MPDNNIRAISVLFIKVYRQHVTVKYNRLVSRKKHFKEQCTLQGRGQRSHNPRISLKAARTI